MSADTTIAVTATVSETRRTLHFFTTHHSEVFDNCNNTDTETVCILMFDIETFGHDAENLVLPIAFFFNALLHTLEYLETEIRQKCNLNDRLKFVLDWDGNLLLAFTDFEKFYRLLIVNSLHQGANKFFDSKKCQNLQE